MTKTITRRGFVAASAAGAALAASGAALAGCASAPAVETAWADEVVNTQCTACPKQCGYAAYVVDGSIDKVVGNAANPYAAGTLCARGYGSATVATSEDRLTDPLKKNEGGTFDTISWDEAIAAIGEAIQKIKSEKGPEALAAITDGTSTADWYAARFMAALGSANSYVNATTAASSIASGLALASGYTACEVDYARAKMVVILGASTVEMPDPGTIAGLAQAKAAGAEIVMVDSRQPASASVATEWLPIKAGTDLALVLALGNVLVSQGLMSEGAASFMAGLDEWEAALAEYTPAWAASVTGIAAERIEQLARELAAAAPAASIDLSWMALYGGAYANTGELARATALVNGLLGSWNAPGGVYGVAAVADWDAALGVVPKAATDATTEEFPVAVGGSSAGALRLAHDGAIAGLLLVNANVVAEYPDPDYVAEALASCELTVAITPEMTETAKLCDFVLPEKVWSESAQLPTVAGAAHPVLVVSSQVIEPAVENARGVDEIIASLAGVTGAEGAFNFTVEDAARAFCEACGCDYEAAVQNGTVALEAAAPTAWPTASGLLECSSAAAADAGLTAVPTWVEPAVAPAALGYEFYRLTTGSQAPTSATTANAAPLAAIAQMYELDGLWMNAAAAADAGIAEGDTVTISNEYHTALVPVHLTEAIEPASVYLASHYGVEDDEQTNANGLGARQGAFATYSLEPAYGAPLLQEVMVTVEKAGA